MSRIRNSGGEVPSPYFGESYFTSGGIKYATTNWWSTGTSQGVVLPDEVVCLDELHAGPPYKTGGPFDLTRFETSEHNPNSIGLYANSWYRYEGGFKPSPKPSSYLPSTTEAWGDISSFGPTAWNRFRPTRPKVSFGQAVVELRDIPRMLKTSALEFREKYSGPRHWSRRTANQWVNINFGWVPFLNDLCSFYKTTKKLNDHYQQLLRDNGRWVRRGGTVFTNADTELIIDDDVLGIWPTVQVIMSSGATRSYTLTQSQDVWFTALFKYYLPKNPDWRWAKSMLMLYGMVPSPALVWELTPWSWLADWVSNFGDVTEWLSSILLEDLCAKNAYVMGTTRNRVDCTCTALDGTGQKVSVNAYALQERKMRVPATSFGFGLTRNDFTARQWSILGALGLSRL